MDIVKASDGDLGKQLAEHMRQTGKLSSASVQAAVQESMEPAKFAATAEAITETTTIPADKIKTNDTLINADTGDSLNDILKEEADRQSLKRAQVVITPQDKEAFLDAMISNKRMVLKFTRCGGKISVVVRSRMIPETQAIMQQLRREMDSLSLVTQTDYTARLRAMGLAAQIVSVNDTVNDTLNAPLFPTVGADGKTLPPGWLGQSAYFTNISDGLQNIVWGCLSEFEDKYWIMVEDAKDANFWNPAASI